MGKPGVRHEPSETTRRTVKTAIAFGLTQRQICEMLDISLTTLGKFYRREIETGTSESVMAVASRLYKQAMSDVDSQANTVARIFYLKARGGWRDQFSKIEHTGPDGEPLNPPEKRPIVVLLPDNNRGVLPPGRPPPMIEGHAAEIAD